MKRLLTFGALLSLVLAFGCLEPAGAKRARANGLVYEHQFIGFQNVSQVPQPLKLKSILALPDTRELRDYLLPALAKAPQDFWRKSLASNAGDATSFIQPLVADLFTYESVVELRGPDDQLELAVAVRLPAQRAQAWDAGITQWMNAWQAGSPAKTQVSGFQAIELKRAKHPGLIQCVRAKDWTVVRIGSGKLPISAAWLDRIQQSGRPVPVLASNALVSAQFDVQRLATWFPGLSKYRLPPIQLTMTPRGENLRTEATLLYSTPLPMHLEPWRMPTGSIRDPLISFSVARGVAPLLAELPGFNELKLKPLPNQYCAWALADVPWQRYMTFPVPDATNALRQLAPDLPRIFFRDYMGGGADGEVLWISNRAELRWQGLPFVIPAVKAIAEGDNQFLLASLFPLVKGSNAPPDALFAQLNNPKLVYYSWEITQQRLTSDPDINSLYSIIKRYQSPSSKVPTRAWLSAAAPMLGNAVTEVTMSAPGKLSVVRSSQSGFTSAELMLMARYIESPGFPLRWDPPPHWQRLRSSTNAPAGKTTSPKAQGTPPAKPSAAPPSKAKSGTK